MKRRIIGALFVIGTISGCVSTSDSPETGGMRPNYGQSFGPPSVPGVQGPYGEKIPMAAPYNTNPPASQYAAMRMIGNSVPMHMIQSTPNGTPFGGPPGANMPSTMMPPGGIISPLGVPGVPGGPSMNPFQKTGLNSLMPDGGVVNANVPAGAKGPGGVTQAQFAGGGASGPTFPAQRTQVFFPKPAGMKIFWFTQGADGKPNYSTSPLDTPGRYNFAQGAIYRLKLTHIPGRPALELYPTLEVVPTSPRTNEFLAHNSVPLEFTEEDFKQVVDRNYIVKVIYLPDPQFQDGAGAGPDEIVSTRLEPGQDPIQEALRRGSILLVLRIGNIDQGLQHSPPTTAPIPGGGPPAFIKPPGQGVPPLFQVPHSIAPIAPGAGGPIPGQLPPLPAINPPANVPNLPKPPDAKPEVVPPPKKDDDKLSLPPLNLPAPPALKGEEAVKPGLPSLPVPPPTVSPKDEKPFVPPVPNPVDKTEKGASSTIVVPSPLVPAIPTSTSKETGPALPQPPSITLPTLPAVETTPAIPTNLPPLPVPPPVENKQ